MHTGDVFFIRGLYLIQRLSHPKYIANDNALKLINDGNVSYLENNFYLPNGTKEIEQSDRKSRHIHSMKNHPYKYYYIEKQIEKCKKEEFLKKCKKEHQRIASKGRYYESLVLNVGYFPCFCPPSDMNKSNIILPVLNYTYTDEQPQVCKSKNVTDECQKEHLKLKKIKKQHINKLVLKTKNTICYCPPLKKEMFVNIYPPKIERHHIIQNTKVAEKENATSEIEEQFFNNEQKRISRILIERKQLVDIKEYNFIENEDVSVKKMYDFSCVNESENITLIRALEIMATALKRPFVSLSTESVKIHYYNTLHLGCPSSKIIQEVDSIANIADEFLDVFIQIVPGIDCLIIAKNIVSPLLMMLSQTLDNKSISIDLLEEFESNVSFMFQGHIRTVIGNAKNMDSMSGKDIEQSVIDDFNKKFTKSKHGLSIIYKNKVNKLNFDVKKKPYIKTDDGDKFVIYNMNDEKWDELNSNFMYFYSDDNINNANEYSSNKIRKDIVYKINNEKRSFEMQGLSSSPQFELIRIVIMDNIIPVYRVSLPSGEETFITAAANLSPKIIAKTPYGFVFDKESTDISYILGLYIDSHMDGEAIGEKNIYSKIHENKLSYDRYNNAYIKYRGLYFPVELYDESNNIYSMTSEISGEEIYLKVKGSTFDFHDTTTFNLQDLFIKDPSFLSKIKDGYFDSISNPHEIISITSDGQHSGYIYFKAYAELLTSGEVLDSSTIDLHKLDSLIYFNEKLNIYYLNVNNKLYAIEKNTEAYGLISIKNKNNNKSNIKIYHHDDLLIQINEEEFLSEYFQLTSCKIKRDLTDVICKPLFISGSLQKKLDDNIRGGRSTAINDEKIKVFNSDLGLFKRKGRVYFFYKNRFFEVKFNSEGTVKNKFPGTVVDVYANSIFRNKRKIASFMFVNKEKRIELKETGVFLSEKTGNAVADIDFLLENKKYYKISNVFEINNSINEVNRSKKLTIVSPAPFADIYLRNSEINYLCYEHFYNQRNDIDFTVLEMNQITDADDFYIWSGKVKVATHLKFAREVVNKAISLLKRPSRDLDEYLKSILATDNNDIIRQFSENLRMALIKTLDKLDSNLISLVSVVKIPYEESPVVNIGGNAQTAIHYKQILDKATIRTGTFAFSTKVKNARMYVCMYR